MVGSTHLKNISQIGSFPQVGVKRKNMWNHHLEMFLTHFISTFQILEVEHGWATFGSLKSFAQICFQLKISASLQGWAHKNSYNWGENNSYKPISMAVTPVTHSFSPFIGAGPRVTPFINGFWAHLVPTNLECVGPQDPFFSDLCSQPMVNCWFGARWFGFLGSPLWKGLLLRGTRFESQTTGPQTTTWPLAEPKNKHENSHLSALRRSGRQRIFSNKLRAASWNYQEDGQNSEFSGVLPCIYRFNILPNG